MGQSALESAVLSVTSKPGTGLTPPLESSKVNSSVLPAKGPVMKRIVFASLLVSGLLGCASAPPQATFETDYQRMAAIEHAAARTGVRVYWINAPYKQLAQRGG